MSPWRACWVPDEAAEGEEEALSKLVLRAPQRTEPLTGHITDIIFTTTGDSAVTAAGGISQAVPIIPRSSINSTSIGSLTAVDALGSISWLVAATATGPVKLSVSTPNEVQYNALLVPSLNANRLYNFTAIATDARGNDNAFVKNCFFGTYAIPADLTLGLVPDASGHAGTVKDDAAAGTQIGVIIPIASDPFNPGHGLPIGEPLPMHGPLTYEVTTGGSLYEVQTINGQPFLVKKTSSTYTAGVDHPVVTITDADNESVNVTLDITVTATPVATVPSRFDALPLPTAIIRLVWNIAGKDPRDEDGTCNEGQPGTWKAYSTDCPLIDFGVTGATYAKRDDVRRAARDLGYTEYTLGWAVPGATTTDYEGPYDIGLYSLQLDNTGVVEYIGLAGTGFIDAGYDPVSNVKLRDIPYLQVRQIGTANNNCYLDLIGVKGMPLGQSKYSVDGVRYGPTRAQETAAVVKVFNVPGATTSAECILPKVIRKGQGLVIAESAAWVCFTRSEVVGSTFQGMHATKKNRNQRYKGIFQAFDCLVRNNGVSGQEHNVYLGDMRWGVLGYNMCVAPSGHNDKWDNQQCAEMYENSIGAYHLDYIKYNRFSGANGVKTFSGTTSTPPTTYEAALRRIDDPVEIYSWVDDLGGTLVPYLTDASGLVNLGNLTVITNGTPSQGQVLRTITGNTSTSESLNTAVATFTFSDADKANFDWARIPGRGFAADRSDSLGGTINFDNVNQDARIWNNMIHSYVHDSTTSGMIYITGRHQGGDLRHHKMPSYTYQDPSFANEIDMTSVLGGVGADAEGGAEAQQPKTYVAYISTASGNPPTATTYRITQADFAYSGMFGATDSVDSSRKGPLNPDGVTVYDVEGRCDDGTVYTRTMTLTSLVRTTGGSSAEFMVSLSSPPPSVLTGNSDHRNVIVFKKQTDAWDRPLMITADQRDMFDRTAPDYWPYLVTYSSDRTELDFSKQEPSISGEKWGIPFKYVNNNLIVALKPPNRIANNTLTDGQIVQSLNTCFSTKFSAGDGPFYRCRLWMPPLNSSDGLAWADQPYAGNATWRLQTRTAAQTGGPLFGTDGTGGVGIGGSDMVWPSPTVLKENGVFDVHLASSLQKFSAAGNVGNVTTDDSIFNRSTFYPDIRFIPQDDSTPVDLNGCVKFTLADKHQFPTSYDRGKPIVVIGPYGSTGGTASILANNGAGPYDRCRIRTVSGGTPAIGQVLQLECDTQWGVGEGVHNGTITGVTAINATDFDVIFTPGLQQVGDTDTVGNTVTLGHEKGLSVNTATDTKGGRGVFMAAARAPLPSWWLDPTDISDAA